VGLLGTTPIVSSFTMAVMSSIRFLSMFTSASNVVKYTCKQQNKKSTKLIALDIAEQILMSQNLLASR
jgi:hypothetical protein